MLKYTEYVVEDIYSNIANMKMLKIFGDLEFNESDIIRKICKAAREFLNKNYDVNYLIVYYFPTQEDMKNNASLCFLQLDDEIKNIDLLNIEDLSKKIQWNEYYGFFSAVVKDKSSSDYQLIKEANTLLQIIDEAYFILYDLKVTAKYRNLSGPDIFYEYLENWIIKAEHIDKGHGELESITKNDFMSLVRHLSNILHCCLSDGGKTIKGNKERQWILNHELTNARDKYGVVRHQLSYLMRKYLK